MQRPSKHLIAAISLAILAAIALYTSDWLLDACERPSRRIIMKSSGGVGCFEFWFNRYQQMISAIAAFGAAIAFGIPVWRQLNESKRQTSAIMLEKINFQIEDLQIENEQRAMINNSIQIAAGIITDLDEEPIDFGEMPDAFIEAALKASDYMKENIKTLEPRIISSRGSPKLSSAREEINVYMNELRSAAISFAFGWKENIEGPRHPDEDVVSDAELTRRTERLRSLSHRADEIRRDYMHALHGEMHFLGKRRAALELAAFGEHPGNPPTPPNRV